jgi:hypothetical protein
MRKLEVLKMAMAGILAVSGAAAAAAGAETPIDAVTEFMPQTYSPRVSRALNVALASGLTEPVAGPLFDVKRSDIQPNLQDQSSPAVAQSITRGLDLAVAADLFTGGAHGMASGSSGLAGAAFLVSALTGGKPRHPAAQYQQIVWMPRSLAPDAESAAALLKALTQRAVEATFSELGWKTGQIEADTGGLLRTRMETLRTFSGGEICGIRVHCTIRVFVSRPVDAAGASPIASGGPAWIWRNRQPGQEGSYDKGFSWALEERSFHKPQTPLMTRSATFDYEDFNLRMSRHLPGWIFQYGPPTRTRPYPRFYNSGQELVFVEPS